MSIGNIGDNNFSDEWVLRGSYTFHRHRDNKTIEPRSISEEDAEIRVRRRGPTDVRQRTEKPHAQKSLEFFKSKEHNIPDDGTLQKKPIQKRVEGQNPW